MEEEKMKKFVAVLTMVLIFSVCSTTVSAACPMGGRNYVDADGDGICDNYASGQSVGYGRGCHGGRGNGFWGGCGR